MLRTALLAVSAAALSLAFGGVSEAAYPDKPIKIIVPTNAGGAMDTIGRIFQRAFEEKKIIPQKTAIVNLPGAGGTIATRKIKDSEPDGYTIGFWHDGVITSKAMGVVDYDHTAFELIGISGYTEIGLGVRDDSAYRTFDDVVAKLKAEPNTVKVATNIGLPVHFNSLIVLHGAGVEGLMVQAGGGAKRLASILGGHTDTAVFAIPEFIKYKESGLRPLVIFSETGNPLVPGIKTARDSGIDFVAQSNRIWLAPKGTPRDIVNYLSNALQTAMADPEVKKEFESLGVTPEFIGPERAAEMLETYLGKVLPMVEEARTLKK